MVRKITVALATASVMASGTLSGTQKPADKPGIIKLERFRKALWTVHVTVDGKPGEFLLDTGGGNTLLTAEYAAKLTCKFWGRTTGYNMFGKRADGPHCDNVQIKAGDMALSSVSVGTIDFGDRFITLDLARSRLWLAKAL